MELVGIETRGDKILDVPLSQVEGKEFFVAELDQALRSGAVDFTVHSLKDLSLDRPREFKLACIPPRENPRDVIVFGPGIVEKLKAGKTIEIGSSSPRRLENIPEFLAKALPSFSTGDVMGGDDEPALARIEFVEIRGNVNTRLGRVHEPDGSDRHLDGVVLAMAGLIRLERDEKGGAELSKLLDGCRWMILPLKQCPSAPGQGALAIECRENDESAQRMLSKLHDERTLRHVQREREILRQWGGGCHQRFGATCVEYCELGEILYIRGVQPNGVFIDELHTASGEGPLTTPIGLWDGSFWRGSGMEWVYTESDERRLAQKSCVFVAHSRAVPDDWSETLATKRIWTSGAASWFRLARLGLWVEGCSEGFGFNEMASTVIQPVLGLGPISDWTVLTHTGGTESWEQGEVIATYTVVDDRDQAARLALRKASHAFWSSASQYERYKDAVPQKLVHACGPGKTARYLRSKGITPVVFLSSEEWRKWLSN